MKDAELKEFMEWVKEAVKNQHNDQSPLTLEKLKNVTDSLSDFKTDIRGDIQDLRDSVEKNYASKWVEWVAKAMVGAILMYFLGGLLSLYHITPISEAIANIIRFIC